MRYDGDSWTSLFPLLKNFPESDFPFLKIREEQCVSDARQYKYTLYFNQLPIDEKLWRDEDKREHDRELDFTPAKVPKLADSTSGDEDDSSDTTATAAGEGGRSQ